jgi:MerR family transcriptional regulator/heat shock protein HspR
MDSDPGRERRAGPTGQSDERGVYIISVAAELAGVHPQTLRIYERKGLIKPARTSGNTRRYSQRDIDRLRTIQRLTQEEGLNLAGVRMLVEMEDEVERLRTRLAAVDGELQRARRRMRQELERLRDEVRGTDIVPRRTVPKLRVVIREHPSRSGPIPMGPADDGDDPRADPTTTRRT